MILYGAEFYLMILYFYKEKKAILDYVVLALLGIPFILLKVYDVNHWILVVYGIMVIFYCYLKQANISFANFLMSLLEFFSFAIITQALAGYSLEVLSIYSTKQILWNGLWIGSMYILYWYFDELDKNYYTSKIKEIKLFLICVLLFIDFLLKVFVVNYDYALLSTLMIETVALIVVCLIYYLLLQKEKLWITSTTVYKDMKNTVKETNIFIHDLKNTLGYAINLQQNENYEKAEEVLNSHLEKIEDLPKYVSTSYPALDYILNTKIELAKSKGISLECIIDIFELPFSSEELHSVLGNLLDNAIEYETANQLNHIVLKIIYRQKHIIIQVRNKTKEAILLSNPSLKSSKKGMHGLGLYRVKQIVDKHQGMMQWEDKEGYFVISIILPMKNEKEPMSDYK